MYRGAHWDKHVFFVLCCAVRSMHVLFGERYGARCTCHLISSVIVLAFTEAAVSIVSYIVFMCGRCPACHVVLAAATQSQQQTQPLKLTIES
jgi:hypothetical protein